MPGRTRIRVIGADGAQLGIMTSQEGLEKAYALGLDRVEVAPEARPPVCKILDDGKYWREGHQQAR